MTIQPVLYRVYAAAQALLPQLNKWAPLLIATAIMQAYPSLVSASESAIRDLSNKISGDNSQPDIQSLFEKALYSENITALESSIVKGADVNKPYFGKPPLKWARLSGNPEVAQILIKNGAKENHSNTPYRDPDLNELEGEIQAPPEPSATERLNTALFDVAESESGKHIKFLIRKGADVNTRDALGNTPLHRAIRFSNLTAIKALIKKGADLNALNNNNLSLLDTAVDTMSNEYSPTIILETLLKAGIKPNRASTLRLAVLLRHKKAIDLIIGYGTDVNAQNLRGETALHRATISSAISEDPSIVTYLVKKHHANMHITDAQGYTPFHLATRFGILKTMKFLYKNGGSGNLNRQDKDGRTVLHYAAIRSSSAPTIFLIEKGANPMIRDNDGNTALDIAAMRGKTATTACLETAMGKWMYFHKPW